VAGGWDPLLEINELLKRKNPAYPKSVALIQENHVLDRLKSSNHLILPYLLYSSSNSSPVWILCFVIQFIKLSLEKNKNFPLGFECGRSF
jgi:hypothetical protein